MRTAQHRLSLGLIAGLALFVAPISTLASTVPPTPGEQGLLKSIQSADTRLKKLSREDSAASGALPRLARRASGPRVLVLQRFLSVYGVYHADITGTYGPLTEDAVRAFQAKESLEPVGAVGPKTWARIFDVSRQKIADTATASSSPAIQSVALTTLLAEDGSASTTLASFASTSPTLYAVLSLSHATEQTQISYIRYYGGAYVDSEVSHPSRDNLAYMHFQWTLKAGAARPSGAYSIAFYVNGKRSQAVTFTVY